MLKVHTHDIHNCLEQIHNWYCISANALDQNKSWFTILVGGSTTASAEFTAVKNSLGSSKLFAYSSMHLVGELHLPRGSSVFVLSKVQPRNNNYSQLGIYCYLVVIMQEMMARFLL